MAGDCSSLGFEMDCGHVFGEKYGKAASKGDLAKEGFDEDSNMEC